MHLYVSIYKNVDINLYFIRWYFLIANHVKTILYAITNFVISLLCSAWFVWAAPCPWRRSLLCLSAHSRSAVLTSLSAPFTILSPSRYLPQPSPSSSLHLVMEKEVSYNIYIWNTSRWDVTQKIIIVFFSWESIREISTYNNGKQIYYLMVFIFHLVLLQACLGGFCRAPSLVGLRGARTACTSLPCQCKSGPPPPTPLSLLKASFRWALT